MDWYHGRNVTDSYSRGFEVFAAIVICQRQADLVVVSRGARWVVIGIWMCCVKFGRALWEADGIGRPIAPIDDERECVQFARIGNTTGNGDVIVLVDRSHRIDRKQWRSVVDRYDCRCVSYTAIVVG